MLNNEYPNEFSIIDNAVEEYKLDAIYSLFSGGSDSLCATWIASYHPLFKGVIHLDTGIGIKDVQAYVKSTCREYNWELKIYSALNYQKADGTTDPQDYNKFVKNFGFPGGGNIK